MTASARAENRVTGILWMLATMFCFLSLDAIMKHAMETYSLVQVTWARFFFATVFASMFCGKRLPLLIRSNSPKVQLLRSLLLMVTTGLFNAGIMHVPLVTATVIMYLGPLFVTVLSVIVLREKVDHLRWGGVLVGFLGALIVIAPWNMDGSGFNVAVLLFVVAALTNASYQIATRFVRGDDPLTSLLFTAAAGAVVTSCIVPFHWQWPDLLGWLLLAGSGLAGALGHFCIIRSFRAAPASVVAPFSYSSLLWATGFGFLIWGDWPVSNEWIGAAIIMAAGLFIFLRERAAPRVDRPA